jgi:hypothetical protein
MRKRPTKKLSAKEKLDLTLLILSGIILWKICSFIVSIVSMPLLIGGIAGWILSWAWHR